MDDLVVDHLDGDTENNARSNLVPSCQPCNVSAGYNPARIKDGEAYVVRPNGDKLRANEVVCAHCGITFLRAPGLTKSGRKNVYCSKPCAAAGSRLDVCGRGHPRIGDNLTPSGACRDCQRIALATYRAKKSAEPKPLCSVSECGRVARQRGLCSRHLGRKWTPPKKA